MKTRRCDVRPGVAEALNSLPAVFGRMEALSVGLSERTIRTLARQGVTAVVARGQYAKVAGLPQDHAPLFERRLAAHRAELTASLARRSGYAASHLSAAALHGLDLPGTDLGRPQITAITAYQRSRRAPTETVHHSDSVLTEIDAVEGLTVTSLARTVADCLRTLPAQTAVPIADSAIRLHGLDIEAIEGELATQIRWVGRPRALASLALVDGRRESWLESFSFSSLHREGIDLPTPQVEVFDEDGVFIGRVDGLWLPHLCVAEADGKQKYDVLPGETLQHARRRVLLAEKHREERLRAVGLGCVRWGTDEILGDLHAVARRIHREWGRHDPSSFRGSIRIPDPTGRSKCAV